MFSSHQPDALRKGNLLPAKQGRSFSRDGSCSSPRSTAPLVHNRKRQKPTTETCRETWAVPKAAGLTACKAGTARGQSSRRGGSHEVQPGRRLRDLERILQSEREIKESCWEMLCGELQGSRVKATTGVHSSTRGAWLQDIRVFTLRKGRIRRLCLQGWASDNSERTATSTEVSEGSVPPRAN